MRNLTESAIHHLDNDEKINFKILGMLDGKFNNKWIVYNGIFLATNKRLFFYSKKFSTTINYSDINNVEFIERKLNSPTIKFNYKNEKISIKYIDQGDVLGFYRFLKSENTDQHEVFHADTKVENVKREGNEKKEAPKVASVSKERKPLHKRWWFWVVAAIFVFGAIGNMTEDKTEETTASPSAEENVEEQETDNEETEEVVDNDEENFEDKEVEKGVADQKEEEETDRTIDETIVEDNDYVDEATLEDGKLTLIADGKTTFSENTLFYSVYDLFEAMHDGFQDESVNEVYVEIMTTMVDPKGNESVEPVIK